MLARKEWDTTKPFEYKSKRHLPSMFSNLMEAQQSLVSNWHVASLPVRASNPTSMIPGGKSWQHKSKSILARWTSAYDAYLDIRGDNLTNEKRRGTAALRILRELGSAASKLSQTTVDDETEWDIFCPMFAKIVSLTADIVEVDLSSTEERPPHCMSMAIVRPIFEVVYSSNFQSRNN